MTLVTRRRFERTNKLGRQPRNRIEPLQFSARGVHQYKKAIVAPATGTRCVVIELFKCEGANGGCAVNRTQLARGSQVTAGLVLQYHHTQKKKPARIPPAGPHLGRFLFLDEGLLGQEVRLGADRRHDATPAPAHIMLGLGHRRGEFETAHWVTRSAYP